MGRTLPSAAVILMQEEAAFARFRRALRRADQLALDDLFMSARQHVAAAQYASHALPFEVMMLSMLLEEHKEVMRLRGKLEAMEALTSATRVAEAAAPRGCFANGGLRPPRLESAEKELLLDLEEKNG